jgi:hypothetical protein
MMKNKHGREIEYLDILKIQIDARALIGEAAYSVSSDDGIPICGLHVPQQEAKIFTAHEWHE